MQNASPTTDSASEWVTVSYQAIGYIMERRINFSRGEGGLAFVHSIDEYRIQRFPPDSIKSAISKDFPPDADVKIIHIDDVVILVKFREGTKMRGKYTSFRSILSENPDLEVIRMMGKQVSLQNSAGGEIKAQVDSFRTRDSVTLTWTDMATGRKKGKNVHKATFLQMNPAFGGIWRN